MGICLAFVMAVTMCHCFVMSASEQMGIILIRKKKLSHSVRKCDKAVLAIITIVQIIPPCLSLPN